MSIGKNIAKFRKAAGLTQEELGLKLGVTNQAVSKWESEVSMPDILLLPKIAFALGISLENLYGMEKESEKISVSTDDFPTFCHKKLIELFSCNTKMQGAQLGGRDKEPWDFSSRKLPDGCRVGCISSDGDAVIVTGDFAFADTAYKSGAHPDFVRMTEAAENVLRYLSNQNVRKVFFFQYTAALDRSKRFDSEYTFEDVMYACDLTEAEASAALQCLAKIHINETYTDPKTKMKKYCFRRIHAGYALATYKLSELLSENAAWVPLRESFLISDPAFETTSRNVTAQVF